MSRNSHTQYQEVIAAILRKIRGNTSQAHLSSRLGLKHNHVYKWESGTRKIQWGDFVKLCELKKFDLKPLFFELYLFQKDPKDFVAIYKHITMNLPSSSLSQQLGISKFRIESWRNGKGPFYLNDLICIIDKFSHLLIEFILYFLTHGELKQLNLDLTEYEMRQFEVEHPIISLILRALETNDHIQSTQASSKFVAKMIGMEEKEAKALLVKANTLGFVSKKGNKYFSDSLQIDIRGKKAIKQRRFWIEKALQFMDKGKVVAPDYVFGNIIYCVSRRGQNQILDEYLKFYNIARQIIANDNGGDLPMILNLQMLRMDEK